MSKRAEAAAETRTNRGRRSGLSYHLHPRYLATLAPARTRSPPDRARLTRARDGKPRSGSVAEHDPHAAPYRLSNPAAARQAPPTIAAQGIR